MDNQIKTGSRVHVRHTGRAAIVIEIIGAVARVQWVVGNAFSIVPVRMLGAR